MTKASRRLPLAGTVMLASIFLGHTLSGRRSRNIETASAGAWRRGQVGGPGGRGLGIRNYRRAGGPGHRSREDRLNRRYLGGFDRGSSSCDGDTFELMKHV